MFETLLTLAFQAALIGTAVTVIVGMLREEIADRRVAVGQAVNPDPAVPANRPVAVVGARARRAAAAGHGPRGETAGAVSAKRRPLATSQAR